MTDIINSLADAVEEPEVQPNDDSVAVPEIAASELDNNGFIKKNTKKVSLDAKKARAGYIFVLPFLIGLVLVYFPLLIDSLWLSLTVPAETPIGGDSSRKYYAFAGLTNYFDAFDTPNFVTGLAAGLQEIVFQVPAIIVFSLFIAVVLNQKMLGRAVFRAIFFLPVIVSTGIMEVINANGDFSDISQSGIDDGSGGGGANDLISVLDIQALFANMNIPGGEELVGYVVQIVNEIYDIINYSGVQMLIFLAGLQSISPSIYEACKIDGATGWETFWKVTFPMISPIILVNAFYTVIDALTRPQNPMVLTIEQVSDPNDSSAMYWIYFLIIILIVAAIAGICSTFVFYQRRD
ncbi:MAG: sugar ABC transporter permease [Clostridia bacterium]|nr:sugar ABC transporter permease [Clostridia bacterium]